MVFYLTFYQTVKSVVQDLIEIATQYSVSATNCYTGKRSYQN